jgi:tetratricopeptide (TPR) repeat protein
MRVNRHTIFFLFSLILLQASLPAFSQLGFDLNIKKPKEYEERVLRSEKTDKKFNVPRRFVQNTVTHYNYSFNANNKLNEVLTRAKLAFKDDYSKLLSFYNYSLDVTAADSIQLDSITYKASSGIALHDLRNDWVDNLYLLWGASFYLQKDFDSAYQMFQFINYAFAPKEKDGYYKAIGSARDGNSALSISTKEKGGFARKMFSQPPSRNDAFIWQIRNFLAQDEFAEASSLIVTLRDDPAFPSRLVNDLHEVQAYYFYKQNSWDSAAFHLVQALSNAGNQQERARWEYLAGQLYEKAGNYKEARKNYDRAISRTTDLIMEIYARLATIRTNKDDEADIQKNVAELVKMARRDKYTDYQDIIYYMAAQMQLEGNKEDQAMELLLLSTLAPNNNPGQKNKAFLQLADLSFARKEYLKAYNFYDSIKLDDPAISKPEMITDRKNSLRVIVNNIQIRERQDSLQRIAGLPEEERRDYVKKLVRYLRRQQGLKEEQPVLTTGSGVVIPTNQPPVSLFPAGDSKGEWYFYNASSRTRGQSEFKARWGNRPNVDNWRRSASLLNSRANNIPGNNNQTQDQGGNGDNNNGISFEDLYAKLPLTEEQLNRSNDSIQQAMFNLGKAYIQGIEDCTAGTGTLEELRTRFPAFTPMDELLFNLYYCYNKNGETAKAAVIKKQMGEKFASSNLTTIVTTGKNPAEASGNTSATKTYEKIYDLFIEGKFAEAIEQKKTADSLYGNNFWTPQLLYIEAVYHIRQRDDNTAKEVLNSIVARFPSTPLAEKATALIDVLSRRAQIEEELRNYQMTHQADSGNAAPVTVLPVQPVVKPDTAAKKPTVAVVTPPVKKQGPDTLKTQPVTPPVVISTPYGFNAAEKYYVVLVLNKVDPVFMNEAKNAFFRYNRETYYNKTYAADLYQLDEENRLLLMSPFTDATDAVTYVEKTRPKTASDIIPWLKGGKYYFTIITESNLQLLKTSKDLEAYKRFLEQHLPGKF